MALIDVSELKGKSRVEVAQILRAKSDEVFEMYKDKVVPSDSGPIFKFDDPIKDIEEYRKNQEVLGEIGKYHDTLADAEGMASEMKARLEKLGQPVSPMLHAPLGGDGSRPVSKTVGKMFTESKQYLTRKEARRLDSQETWDVSLDDFDFKTTFATGAGFAPANDRTSIVVPSAQDAPVIQNYIPSITTDLDAIKYMDESTFTNNMTGTAENAALTEVAIAYTERSQTVENVGGFLPVTEQQLEIAEGVESLLNDRLMLMYGLTEQSKIVSGSGSTPQLLGFYNKSGLQTQAVGSDPVPSAMYKAMTLVRWTGFAEPDLTVWHPNDWMDVRLLRDLNGNYIWGNPSLAGPETIWGKPVVQSTAATENSPFTGAFRQYSALWRKRGARIEVGIQNDDWVKMKKTIRIYGRLALVIYRGAAFAKVTGA